MSVMNKVKMGGWLIVFFIVVISQHSTGANFQLCGNTTIVPSDCEVCYNSTIIVPSKCDSQIWGARNSDDATKCIVNYVPPDSTTCMDSFSLSPVPSSPSLGQIGIQPFVLHLHCPSYTYDHAIPNIVFSGIKWKELKFRIMKRGSKPLKRHCRSLVIPDNMTADDRTVLQYDCYKSLTDGRYGGLTHVLDVEATDGTVVDQRQFLFYIPSARMLNPIPNEMNWKPFVYVENLITKMQLRIVPPPAQLNFTYRIAVNKSCKDCPNDVVVQSGVTVKREYNDDEEITYDYEPTSAGSYYFVVTTVHDQCVSEGIECQVVKSAAVLLAVKPNMLYLFMLIVGLLIVISLILYFIYRRYCKDPSEIPKPTKVVVIYPSASRVHSECVASFVDYLRSEYGLDISYDGDVPTTFHCDPYFWAEDVIRQASHIMYIVGPKENEDYSNSALQNVDKLLLSFLRAIRAIQPKEVINVFFEHSTGPVPNETRNDRVFYLLRDWQKLINYLSRDLLPKKQIMRTDKGRCFIDNLTRVRKSLNVTSVV